MEAAMRNSVADYPGVDWNLCLELTGQNASLAEDLLNMFVDTLPDEMAVLTAAFTTKDYVALKNQAHKLHGALCYCGIPDMKTAVLGLEKVCLAFNTDPNSVPDAQESIARHYAEVEGEASKLLGYLGR